MSGELMSDAELDAYLAKLNDDLLATLNKHIDVEAGLRWVLREARVRALRTFRAWFVAFAALTLYLAWVVVVEYRVRAHEPGFVLPNLAVLLGWWPVFVRTYVGWRRVGT